MGGGTGLSTLLRGLKEYVARRKEERRRLPISDLAAVVTVTDDGGSSGRLRREYSVLPPGDIRNCIVALSKDETLLSQLFQYRFAKGGALRGHSFGNIFLTALTQVTGDFPEAVGFRAKCSRFAVAFFLPPKATSLSKLNSKMAILFVAKRKFPAREAVFAAFALCRATSSLFRRFSKPFAKLT